MTSCRIPLGKAIHNKLDNIYKLQEYPHKILLLERLSAWRHQKGLRRENVECSNISGVPHLKMRDGLACRNSSFYIINKFAGNICTHINSSVYRDLDGSNSNIYSTKTNCLILIRFRRTLSWFSKLVERHLLSSWIQF